MSELGPRPGDVVLVNHGPSKSNPVSLLIQKVTGSPYSHSIVALGDGLMADANPLADTPDLRTFSEARLAGLVGEEGSLLLLRNLDPPAPGALRVETDKLIARAADQGDPILFSDGALAGLAALTVLGAGLLRTLDDVVPGTAQADIDRMRAAIFHATEDGDRRLFCSEFVYRVLQAADARPLPPERRVVSLDGFPTDEPPPRAAASWLDTFRAWLRTQWDNLVDWVLKKLTLDRQSLATFDEVWDRIVNAYRQRLRPAQLTVANFWTPADFAASPSFDEVPGWVPRGA